MAMLERNRGGPPVEDHLRQLACKDAVLEVAAHEVGLLELGVGEVAGTEVRLDGMSLGHIGCGEPHVHVVGASSISSHPERRIPQVSTSEGTSSKRRTEYTKSGACRTIEQAVLDFHAPKAEMLKRRTAEVDPGESGCHQLDLTGEDSEPDTTAHAADGGNLDGGGHDEPPKIDTAVNGAKPERFERFTRDERRQDVLGPAPILGGGPARPLVSPAHRRTTITESATAASRWHLAACCVRRTSPVTARSS